MVQDGARQVGVCQVDTGCDEVTVDEFSAGRQRQWCPSDSTRTDPGQGGLVQVDTSQVGPCQGGSSQVDVLQVDVRQVDVRQVDTWSDEVAAGDQAPTAQCRWGPSDST